MSKRTYRATHPSSGATKDRTTATKLYRFAVWEYLEANAEYNIDVNHWRVLRFSETRKAALAYIRSLDSERARYCPDAPARMLEALPVELVKGEEPVPCPDCGHRYPDDLDGGGWTCHLCGIEYGAPNPEPAPHTWLKLTPHDRHCLDLYFGARLNYQDLTANAKEVASAFAALDYSRERLVQTG